MVSGADRQRQDVTSRPLYRVTLVVYGLLGATVCFLLGCAPFIAALLVSPSMVITVIAGFSIGPSWVALLYLMRRFLDDRDVGPFATYWRGYRLSWRQAWAFWVPYLIVLTMIAVDVAMIDVTPALLRYPLMVIGAGSLLWSSTVLLIISRYNFRTRDVLRLAVWGLVRSPGWLIADAAILVVAAGATYLIGDAGTGFLAALFALFSVRSARGLFAKLDADFVADDGSVAEEAAG
jgi:hypothetical protein